MSEDSDLSEDPYEGAGVVEYEGVEGTTGAEGVTADANYIVGTIDAIDARLSGALTARTHLVAALRDLRFGAAMPPTPEPAPDAISGTTSEVVFLDAVTAWVTRFGGVLESVARTTEEMDEELNGLRNQRRQVRAFLGTGEFHTKE